MIVAPPLGEQDDIQEIRARRDKAFDRWMPHINMLWPFRPAACFGEAVPQLQAALAQVPPFKLALREFAFFEHSKSCTVFLRPETEPADALQQLQQAMLQAFPDCDDLATRHENGFSPHLTCGQWAKAEVQRAVERLNADWEPLEFEVTEVQVISRGNDTPFEVAECVPLGGGRGAQSAGKALAAAAAAPARVVVPAPGDASSNAAADEWPPLK